jgi:hypothetical protein
MHAVAVLAEILHVCFRQRVGLSQHDTVALPPLQELAKFPDMSYCSIGFVTSALSLK